MEDFNEILADFIEKEGFTSMGNDMFQDRDGAIHHVDFVVDMMKELMSDLNNF